MRDEIYGVSRIIRGTIVSRFDPPILHPSFSSSLDYFYHIPFAALLRRFESNRPSLSLSLSIAILNPFSSPEDEDWIGRNVGFFRWNCRERKREGMYIQDGGNVASSPRFVRLVSSIFLVVVWKKQTRLSSLYQIYEHSSIN